MAQITSAPEYRVDRTIQKPHSALNRSLTSSGSKFEGRPTLTVLGGSARTLGNMNRPIIAVNMAQPAANDAQATVTQVTSAELARNPRRVAPAADPASLATVARLGLGGTVA